MQRSLLFKIVIVGLLAILLYVPLTMIQATIWERMRYRDEAVRSITADSVSEQVIVGPVLVVPYTETWEEEFVDATNKSTRRQLSANKKHYIYPNEMQIVGNIDTDQRYRGIHKVLVYTGHHKISGDFMLPGLSNMVQKDNPKAIITVAETPYISMGLSDTRGLRNFPKLTWNEQTIEFKQGSKLSSFQRGIHAGLDGVDLASAKSVKFKIDLDLDGIEKLSFAPLAKNNQVTLASNWPHVQYGGRFLPSPKGRVNTDKSVSANWNISSLSSNAQQQMTRLENAGNAVSVARGASQGEDGGLASSAASSASPIDIFSVSYIEPVNIYSQADRAVKYGLMFVALTFAAFFLFEVLKQLPIHPVQYTLVGLALVIFFLLLVSLSEKISFVLAYLIASAACILLIGIYLANVLRDRKRGFGFACALTVLYGILFGLLSSENNAMMMGSLLLFAVLSGIMIATRKVDWYKLGKPATDSAYNHA